MSLFNIVLQQTQTLWAGYFTNMGTRGQDRARQRLSIEENEST